ncbi:MAG: thiamine pyrophosphate-dependent enzyme [Sporichthyaceae bacterium]|nr:thiamine pyrophosphate-dependent enzyme [Sporichthyaceae bacterium]
MRPNDPTDEHFLAAVGGLRPGPGSTAGDLDAPVRSGAELTRAAAIELFDAQLTSRHLDLAARWLREQGFGYYTISSAGHEGNAAVAAALRPSDPALLHYRSGGFYCARAGQVFGHDPIRDVLLGLVAAADEPISGGRHKVFGSLPLSIIPQTSTIASHLPRAVGVAFAIERARKIGVTSRWPDDAVVVASFGDASANHSTALGAMNAASWTVHQGLPLPLLLVCEDNGLGISVRTPPDWIETAFGARPGTRFFSADGCDLVETYQAAREAADWVRSRRRPAFLHLRMIRLMAHAGSDVETGYRSGPEIAADLARDPLLSTARLLVDAGVLTAEQVVARYEAIGEQVRAAARKAAFRPRLSSPRQIMEPIAPSHPYDIALAATRQAPRERRTAVFGDQLPEGEGPLTLAQAINRALLDASAQHPNLLVFGEDVGRKGGVYGITRGLQRKLGPSRVFDTLLDEQTILGLALGAGVSGLLPVPEIQYLAYLHNAEDQLRGEAATLGFFSQGQYRNPMVVRIAGYGYQRGFGGHFHNDNAVGVLRDIPGLVIASPSRPDDAAAMLRTCLAAAEVDGRVCVFLEPIALYHARDLYVDGDGGWLAPYPFLAEHVPVGRARTYGDGGDLTIATFGNGVYLSVRVARRLEAAGVGCRVVDLRWLAPLPVEDLLREAAATGRVLVVDETRRSGGVSEGVITALVDGGFTGQVVRVASEDSFIPLGDAANAVLVSEDGIEKAAMDFVR